MPRTCTVCSHMSRRKIDAQIVFGKSNRTIAAHFGLTPTSVQRHKKHVAAALERASEKRELSIGEGILDGLVDLRQRGLRLLEHAEKAKNHSACVGYLRELRSILASLYEVSRAVVPADQRRAPLPEEWVAAICTALGTKGPFVPRINRGEAALLRGSNGNGAIDVIDISNDQGNALDPDLEGELPILP